MKRAERAARIAIVEAESKNCRSLADFEALALRVGYKKGWALFQWEARQKKNQRMEKFLAANNLTI